MITGIVAADQNWAIGKDNGLLAHLPGDMKYFREKTMGKKIVMGRKTLESFPGGRPLPGRENIVLSRDPDFAPEGCTICRTKEEVLSLPGDLMIIGGASIYTLFLDSMDCILVTKILDRFAADTWFPDLDNDPRFSMTWESAVNEEKGIKYKFTRYDRI